MQADHQSLTDLLATTYDKCYDDCQTAITLEGQSNVAASDQYWRAVLGRIQSFRASLAHGDTDTSTNNLGKDAFKGLRELELTAQEHLDLHEGLRLSLQSLSLEDPFPSRGSQFFHDGENSSNPFNDPAPPPTPPRPPLPPRASSSSGHALVSNSRTSSSDSEQPRPMSSRPKPPHPLGKPENDRSPSPSAHKIRRTLRTGKSNFRSRDSRPTAPGADKAAAAAWIARDARSSYGRPSHDASSGPSLTSSAVAQPSPPPSAPTPPAATPQEQESFNMRYDRHTRRLVPREAARGGDQPPQSAADASSVSNTRNSNKPPARGYFGNSQGATGAGNDPRPSNDFKARPRHTTRKTEDPAIRTPSEDVSPPNTAAGNDGQKTLTDLSSLMQDMNLRETPLNIDGGGNFPDSGSPSGDEKSQQGLSAAMDIVEDSRASTGAAADSASDWEAKRAWVLENLPSWVEKQTATQILDEIDPNKDVVRWADIAGLDEAKNALKEAVVYPFLRPDLFKGLREPPRGILLFGPPGTGKTMLARAVATESESTYIAVTASSLNSKFLGESEKFVRALFTVAKMLAPSIIFVDEVDSVLSRRSSSGEHEASRRLKTEFLIQWSSLEKSSAGRPKAIGDNRVLVLAATNRPWDLDDAATRRFARRQYIPLPEAETRGVQLRTLLELELKHCLTNQDVDELVQLTDGYSGSDITHLARQASYGPLRFHGEAVLRMSPDEIRPVELSDFVACLRTVRPSVNQDSLKQFDDWARQFGERIA